MYHSVGDCSDDPYRITVTPERLDAQLAWLRRRGLRGVVRRPSCSPPAPGARAGAWSGSPSTTATPTSSPTPCRVLRRYGCTATLFVLPGRLGGDNAWDPLGPRKPLLTADGIRHAAGRRAWRSARTA